MAAITLDSSTLSSIALLLGIVGFLAALLLYALGERTTTSSRKRLVVKPSTLSQPAQRKADEFRKIGPVKTFYYVDELLVADLYPMVTQQQLTRIERTESISTRKGIGAKLHFLGGRYQKDSAAETKQIFDVSRERAVKYNEVEKYLLDRGLVTFGLDSFEFDKSKITEFQSLSEQMMQKCNFEIPQDVQDNFISKTMKEFAITEIERLAKATGYVGIIAELSSAAQDDGYILTFNHPTNEYLSNAEYKVTLRIKCPSTGVTNLGHSVFRQAKPTKIACLGKIVSWDPDHRAMEISPIAIF